MAWIGFDFDGTLAKHCSFDNFDLGEPVIPVLEHLKALIASGIECRIFTARVCQPEIRDEQIALIEAWCLKHVGVILPITNAKDFDMWMFFDDRAVQVERDTGRFVIAKELLE